MKQRGIVIPPFVLTLIPYVIGALFLMGTLTAAYQFVDNRWATDAGIAEGKKRAMADVQPRLDACHLQELAVSDLVKEGEERKARAADGLKAAQEGTKAARTEADRLRALAKGGAAATACPAASAVEEIRKGLGNHK